MKKYIILFVLAISSLLSYGQDLLSLPKSNRLLNDYANIFTASEAAFLERKLSRFSDTTSNQILIVTTDDLYGEDISYVATELGHKWGVGKESVDNGIIILIKNKTQSSSGGVYIGVGYGLEGAIPDATANMIVNNEMLPNFSQGDMFNGVDSALDVLFSLASKEYSHKDYGKKGSSFKSMFYIAFFILIFFIAPLLRGRNKNITVDGQTAHGVGGILPWLLLGSMTSRGGGGGFGDFSSGGGDFGGFGGGDFGGGGAGGSW